MPSFPLPWIDVPVGSRLHVAVSNNGGFAAHGRFQVHRGDVAEPAILVTHNQLASGLFKVPPAGEPPLKAGDSVTGILFLTFLDAQPTDVTVTARVLDQLGDVVPPTYEETFTGKAGDPEVFIPFVVKA
jgi:hypothetical protein